ncbi:hypothetical protein TIFTF001_029104 [Ficus carica]|uniref:Uncharacterized protein n=1 Tax=Ficus carica TaxID=3494 RepID=A0AA88DR82_FICCA|nr:hypothetical protein TIFTF001_029104 [Ficus carica]
MIPRIVRDLANPNFLWIARIWYDVVLTGHKLITYVHAVGRSVTSWYQSKFPAIQFHSSAASATVLLDEEDREVPSAFRGMEEEPRIFDETQGVAARYGDPLQIM